MNPEATSAVMLRAMRRRSREPWSIAICQLEACPFMSGRRGIFQHAYRRLVAAPGTCVVMLWLAAVAAPFVAELLTPSSICARSLPRKLLFKPAHSRIPIGFDRHRIDVKFLDGFTTVLDTEEISGRLGRGGHLSPGAAEVFARVRSMGGRWRQASGMDRRVLQDLRAKAEQSLGRGIADLAAFYTLDLPPAVDAARVMDALNELPEVELASPANLRTPPPAVPDFVPLQVYLGRTTGGLDAEFAWTVPGGTGEGVTICDMEDGWNLQHEDLPPVTLMIPPGEFLSRVLDDDHGTEVIGTMVSLDNGWGTTGASYGARCAVAPEFLDSGYALFQQILWAASQLEAGDVILIERHTNGPYYQGDGTLVGFIPIEWEPPVYNAVLTAVGNGIHVVEVAGNGSQNLDAPLYAAGNYGNAPFLPENDSGAIVVGAGVPPTAPELGPDRSRSWFSNFGSRVDVQAWGHRVVTTGAGDLYSEEGPNRWYTRFFGGTSSAAPLVASAVASLEGIAERRTGRPVPPSIMRKLLIATGAAQQDGAVPAALEPIGPRPDLRAAIDRMSTPIVSSPRVVRGFEGDTLRFVVHATDLDGEPIDALTTGSLPGGATFQTAVDNSRGDFEWPTQSGQAGAYLVIFKAANNAQANDTTRIELASAERGPVITVPGVTLGVEGGPLIRVTVMAADPNGDPITSFTAPDLPRGATFVADSTNESGSFTWRPDFDQAGLHIVTLRATSASAALGGQEEVGYGSFGIAVINNDRAPIVVSPSSLQSAEGQPISFTVSARDPDGDAITSLEAADLPLGAGFEASSSNELATFTWTPEFDQAGTYWITFRAKNAQTGSDVTQLTVANVDRPPNIAAPLAAAGTEGVGMEVAVTAADPDGDPILSLAAEGLPVGSTFAIDPGNVLARFSWTPRSGDAGQYVLTLIASSRPGPGFPARSDTSALTITVESGHFAARAFVGPPGNPIRLGTGGASTCIRIEAVDGAFDVARVDLTTVRFAWPEGDPQASASAMSAPPPAPTDVDQNGIPDIEACFPKNDLRQVFAGLSVSQRNVQSLVSGRLLNGGSFEGAVDLEVITQLGIRDAAVTPNPSRTIPVLTFHTAGASRARLAIFDVQGRLVDVVLNTARLDPGFHDVPLRTARGSLRTGIYYYKLDISGETAAGRFAILR